MLQLFINNQEVELSQEETIELNYKVTETEKPTAVRNSFSKTISIKGTANNNKIFNNLFRNDKVGGFDTKKRNEATIYSNGDIVESGYVQITEVQIGGNGDVTYNIVFYGGIGDVFYNLMYNDEGNQKNLADLTYGFQKEDGKILEWNTDYLKRAWNKLGRAYDNSVESAIVPVTSYSGLYEDFDANKVIIKADGSEYLPMTMSDGEDTYTTKNGYALIETPRDIDEYEARCLITKYQRPALRVRALMDAIFNPINNGGYNIELKSDELLDKYLDNAYIVMPRIDFENDDLAPTEEIPLFTNPPHAEMAVNGARTSLTSLFNTGSENERVVVSVTGQINIPNTDNNAPQVLHNVFNYSSYWYCTPYVYQARVRKGRDVISASEKIIVLSNNSYEDFEKSIVPIITDNGDRYRIEYRDITPQATSPDYTTYTHDAVEFVLDLPSDEGLHVEVVCWQYAIFMQRYGTRYQYQYLTTPTFATDMKIKKSKYIYRSITNIFTYDERGKNYRYDTTLRPDIVSTAVTKKLLFNGSKTPYDYLIGISRLFGLRYSCNTAQRLVTIEKRGDYYTDEVIDIDTKIDRSQGMKITPQVTTNKYYEFCLNTPDTYASYLYGLKETTGYGGLLIDTGYYFNATKNNPYSDTVYNNAIPYRLSSVYFGGDSKPSPLNTKTYKYTLFNNSDPTNEKELERVLYGLNEYRKFDSIPKLCLFDKDNGSIDDGDFICLFNGFKSVTNFCVSDVNSDMLELNSNPCYIYDPDLRVYSIPQFTKQNDKEKISLDFINPSIHYDEITYNYRYIGDEYWSNFLFDLYDEDSRIVECYVIIDENPKDALRKFYTFDNSMWVLNEIQDYKPRYQKPIKCKFIKLRDKKNYLK